METGRVYLKKEWYIFHTFVLDIHTVNVNILHSVLFTFWQKHTIQSCKWSTPAKLDDL